MQAHQDTPYPTNHAMSTRNIYRKSYPFESPDIDEEKTKRLRQGRG